MEKARRRESALPLAKGVFHDEEYNLRDSIAQTFYLSGSVKDQGKGRNGVRATAAVFDNNNRHPPPPPPSRPDQQSLLNNTT